MERRSWSVAEVLFPPGHERLLEPALTHDICLIKMENDDVCLRPEDRTVQSVAYSLLRAGGVAPFLLFGGFVFASVASLALKYASKGRGNAVLPKQPETNSDGKGLVLKETPFMVARGEGGAQDVKEGDKGQGPDLASGAVSVPRETQGAKEQTTTDKLPDGHHSIVYADGSTYSGQWQDGNRHGRGVFCWPNGDRYEGEWVNGAQHGQGTLATPDGSVYFGGWCEGYMDGQGVFKPPAPTSVVYLRTYSHGTLIKETSLRVDDVDPVRKAQMKEQRRKSSASVAAARPLQPGEVIYKGHHSFDLMRQLQMGIMYSVAQAGLSDASYVLSPVDFASNSVQYFPAGSTGETPAFKWKDYAPRAFQQLREMFGIDSADYLMSITGGPALRELLSPGHSGAIFFLSADDRFMIKSVRKEEMEVLLGLVRKYHNHVAAHPRTTLVRFFGIHRVSPWLGRNARFIVMGNVLPTDKKMHRKYDLKGSTYKRTVGKERLASDPGATLKDLDLDLEFELPKERYALLMNQLIDDITFLESLHVIDYSLLLGVRFLRWGENEWYPPREDWPSSQSVVRYPTQRRPIREGSMAGALLVETLEDMSTSGMIEPALSKTAADVVAHADEMRKAARISAATASAGKPSPPLPAVCVESGDCGGGGGGGGGVENGGNVTATATTTTTTNISAMNNFDRRRVLRSTTTDEEGSTWAIPAIARRTTSTGSIAREPVMMYFGIIDILQKYNARKRFEHVWKTSLHGDIVSVADPHHYAQRFLDFMKRVFVLQENEEISKPPMTKGWR